MGLNTVNGEKGHILIVAIILITTMSLILAMVIAPIRTQKQRLKEQDLIYRGEHLAEGIRRFYFKYRRFPFELEELIESDPRLVRQLYADPMAEDGEWELIYLVPQDQGVLRVMRRLIEPQTPDDQDQDNPSDGSGQDEDSVFNIKTQQITGIRSKSSETGLTKYQESQIYSDWEFTALPKEAAISKALGSATVTP